MGWDGHEDRRGDSGGFKDNVVEYYVDGGVLNNYPIDHSTAGGFRWKRMTILCRIVGEGGHKNCRTLRVVRRGNGARAVKSKTIGFGLHL